MIKCYERKDRLWISGKKDSPYAEIIMPIGEKEIFIQNDQAECSNTDDIFLNNKALKEKTFTIEKGTRVSIEGYELIFYENYLEIRGELEACQIVLKASEGENVHFEGFPYYSRSPRIIYRIEKEKIEIKSPPEKKTFTKGGIAQMVVPTLSTTAFSVFMGVMLGRGPYVYMSVGMTLITLFFSIKEFLTQKKTMSEENAEREQCYEEYLLRTRKKIRDAPVSYTHLTLPTIA